MEASTQLRSDAALNRRRILDAARRLFGERGLEVCVDDVAREAGVGVGTLYRRFPTKDALIAAILEDRVEVVVGELGGPADEDAGAAFARAAETLVARVAEDRGFYDAIHRQLDTSPELEAQKQRLRAAFEPLLESARAAGAVRADVTVADVVPLLARLGRLPDWRRPLAIVLDGLRPAAATPLP